MLSKILVTALIIGAILLFFKKQNQSKTTDNSHELTDSQSLSPKALTYIVIGILVITSAGLFIYKYQADNQLLQLTVTNNKGETIQYIVKKKDLHGREFTTIKGTFVTIGTGDRIEIKQH